MLYKQHQQVQPTSKGCRPACRLRLGEIPHAAAAASLLRCQILQRRIAFFWVDGRLGKQPNKGPQSPPALGTPAREKLLGPPPFHHCKPPSPTKNWRTSGPRLSSGGSTRRGAAAGGDDRLDKGVCRGVCVGGRRERGRGMRLECEVLAFVVVVRERACQATETCCNRVKSSAGSPESRGGSLPIATIPVARPGKTWRSCITISMHTPFTLQLYSTVLISIIAALLLLLLSPAVSVRKSEFLPSPRLKIPHSHSRPQRPAH